jgi:hypothetical protein
MESTELRNQLNLKQTELNFTKDIESRKKIETAMSVIKLKLEIEKIKDRIKFLNQR